MNLNCDISKDWKEQASFFFVSLPAQLATMGDSAVDLGEKWAGPHASIGYDLTCTENREG